MRQLRVEHVTYPRRQLIAIKGLDEEIARTCIECFELLHYLKTVQVRQLISSEIKPMRCC